ncbi:sulfate transporter family-domain-containing protein [Cladochytrium replicatum]|nr:sulfate transporter family-domain-containing protein [Cladochytrium replicatum]
MSASLLARLNLPNVPVDNTEVKNLTSAANKEKLSAASHVKNYFVSLFPVAQWIGRYNLKWAVGDLIAGFTVGFLVLPQALAQAKIATLPPEYGLYTAFVGLFVYAWFATAKDATIGPTAVLSLMTSQLLASANKENGQDVYPPVTFAVTVAFIMGCMQAIIGFLRLGFIVDFIPATVINGFTTGAATTIIIQQLPSFLGLKGIDTNTQPSYLVVRDIFSKVSQIKVDAAISFSAVAILITLKALKDVYGKRNKWLFWIGIARNGIVLVVYLIISYAIVKSSPIDAKTGLNIAPYTIVGSIPAGLKTPAVPRLDSAIFNRALSPAITAMLVGIVEHIGIVRSFGNKFGYTRNINPSQEIIALGLTNIVGSFFYAYPATGSFSRSAVKAASGVRTPAAGWVTAVIVIIGLYALTGVFYFIPSSLLAAIIIGAMSELISPYWVFIRYWNVSILDFIVSQVALWVTLLTSVENGIYSAVGIAAGFLLIRQARPDLFVFGPSANSESSSATAPFNVIRDSRHPDGPLVHSNGTLVISFQESITYPNSQFISNKLLEVVHTHTRFTGVQRAAGDRLWFDNTEERALKNSKAKLSSSDSPLVVEKIQGGDIESSSQEDTDPVPTLVTIVLDFGRVNSLDAAGHSLLLDLRNEASRFAGHPVRLYFAGVKDKHERVILDVLRTPYPEDVEKLVTVDAEDAEGLYQSAEGVFFATVGEAVDKANVVASRQRVGGRTESVVEVKDYDSAVLA